MRAMPLRWTCAGAGEQAAMHVLCEARTLLAFRAGRVACSAMTGLSNSMTLSLFPFAIWDDLAFALCYCIESWEVSD